MVQAQDASQHAAKGNMDCVDAEHTEAPLLGGNSDIIVYLPGWAKTSNSQLAGPGLNVGEVLTAAAPVVEIDVKIPDNYVEGDKVPVKSPHGEVMEVVLPPGAQAGRVMTMRQCPPADLRIKVPQGLKAGQTMFFESSASHQQKIAVKIPKGVGPGETFEVIPPAVMVCVPKGGKAGDSVVFELNGKRCRTTIPESTQLGHFACRIPKPDDQVGLE